MDEKNIKKLIIVIIITIIILIIGLIAINSVSKKQEKNEIEIEENDISYVQGTIKQNIEDLEYNNIEYIHVTDKQIAEKYFEDYINLMQENIKEAYNLLDEDYKIKRFDTFEKYNTYVQNNLTYLKQVELKNINIDEKDDIKQYTCKDQLGNKYIFNEISVMEYTVQLDDYTLDNLEFNKTYTSAVDRDKGLLNIDKFFKMINMQDYASAYDVLDEGFKQNYFKTQKEFENYMKNKIFRYNKVDYKEYSSKTKEIYTYKILIKDMLEQKQNEVEFNIVMKFQEGTNFVMSFEIN